MIKEKEKELTDLEGQVELFDTAEYKRQTELPLKEKIKEEIQSLQWHLDNVDSLCNTFNWGLDFFEIMGMREGFDIVIGNPPYGIKVSGAIKDEFGLGNKDSYGVFTSLALKILRPGGTLSFIMSDTYQTIRTHKKLRDQLLSQTDTQYLISVPNDTFAATVNPGVYSFVKRLKPEQGGDNWILAADFSTLSIEKGDVEAAFELLMEQDSLDDSKDGYAIWSDREMAIFAYRQKLIPRFSNHSFFIASPKLFGLMCDTGRTKFDEKGRIIHLVEFNGKELELVKLGDVAEVKKGIDTGDNDFFLYKKNEQIRGKYRVANPKEILSNAEIEELTDGEKISGIDLNRFDGKYLIPYDKGGASEIEEGWLPNYYVPTEYFIDWSIGAVEELSKRKAWRKKQAVLRNSDYWFRKGITFSLTGFYCPTFRISAGAMFDNNGSMIFSEQEGIEFLLGFLCSKLNRYFFNLFIDHTVHAQVNEMKGIIIKLDFKGKNDLEDLVSQIITNQKQTPRYDYMTNEQVEIDRLVYEMYNLNEEDIKEVENWYFRRYPKLARVIEEKIKGKQP